MATGDKITLANNSLSNITDLGKILELDGDGSGLDADLLRGLPADFTANIGQNGYTKLPNGLIIQWGGVDFKCIPKEMAIRTTNRTSYY